MYSHALGPGAWTDASLLTLTDVRHVHQMALGPAWDVAPHPNATEREMPGRFREHEIAPFPSRMTPPSWGDDGQWRSSRAWVDDYRSRRHRREP